jgi:hypothetical protein
MSFSGRSTVTIVPILRALDADRPVVMSTIPRTAMSLTRCPDGNFLLDGLQRRPRRYRMFTR